jgi:D-alanine-D-alanine ligase-like ATP-grasp enzyme
VWPLVPWANAGHRRLADHDAPSMTHLRVGVVFGGRSVEHEVSVLSGHQVMAAMDPALYEAVPVYIAKSGAWYTGEPVGRLDEYRDPEALVARAQRVQLSTDPAPPRPRVPVGRAPAVRRW